MTESQPTPIFLSAIVLAGGRSSRMGQDKALLLIDGVPLLQRVCRVAQQCADPVFVITPHIERYQPIVDQRVRWIREVARSGEPFPHGPLMGFVQALAQADTEWVLLLACDLPRLQTAQVQQWITHLSSIEAQTIALLPQHPGGWWEPLCGFYHRQCLPRLEAYVAQGGRSFQRWLAVQPERSVQPLPLPDPHVLFNCNTPDDLQTLQQR